MSLMPKRVKYRKPHRDKRGGPATGGAYLSFGEYGLKAMSNGWVTARQIEAARVAIARQFKRGGKMWIRIFPDKAVTKKPAETRMGKGKGMVDHWVAVVKRGRIMFEIDGLPEESAKETMRLAAYKIPLATRFVSRKTEWV